MPRVSVDVDITGVETEFPVLPAGEYLVQYELPQVDLSKRSGKPILKTQMKVLSPPTVQVDGKEVQVAGRCSLFERISLAPNAPFTLKARLTAAGVPYEIDGATTVFDTEDFLGKQVFARVSVTEDEGRKFNQVDSTRPVV
jgi:hypothetical protein